MELNRSMPRRMRLGRPCARPSALVPLRSGRPIGPSKPATRAPLPGPEPIDAPRGLPGTGPGHSATKWTIAFGSGPTGPTRTGRHAAGLHLLRIDVGWLRPTNPSRPWSIVSSGSWRRCDGWAPERPRSPQRAGSGVHDVPPHRKAHPQRDSNPCYRLERAASWAARRWGPGARGRSTLSAPDSRPLGGGVARRGVGPGGDHRVVFRVVTGEAEEELDQGDQDAGGPDHVELDQQ